MRKWEPRLLLLGAYFSFQILRVGNVLFLYEHGMYNLFCLAMFIWLKMLNWKKMKEGGDTCYIGHAKFWKRYDVTVDSWEEVFFKVFFFFYLWLDVLSVGLYWLKTGVTFCSFMAATFLNILEADPLCCYSLSWKV